MVDDSLNRNYMSWVLSIGRYILLFFLVGVLVSVFQSSLMDLYKYSFPNEIGGGFDIDFTPVVVLLYSIDFFLPLFTIAFGDRRRYWVASGVVGLLGIFEYFADQFNFGTPLLLLTSGVVLGLVIRLIATRTLGKMPSLEPMKKYF